MIDLPVVFNPAFDIDRPVFATEGAAGFDVRADIATPHVLHPTQMHPFPTGLYFEVPKGYELQVRPRSGLAYKHMLTVMNSPGTIDSDYRGEVFVMLVNHGSTIYSVQPNERIAQCVLKEQPVAVLKFVDKLGDTERGQGAFGSTGRV